MSDFEPLMGAGKHAQVTCKSNRCSQLLSRLLPPPQRPSNLRLHHCDSRFWRTLIHCWHGGGGIWESAHFIGDHEQSLEPAARL